LYKSYLEKQLLKPDESQSKVVYQLQGLYERLKDYDPQQKSSKLHFDFSLVPFNLSVKSTSLYILHCQLD